MSDISKIKTPDGVEYDIKDTASRTNISGLTTSLSTLQGRVTVLEGDPTPMTISEIGEIVDAEDSINLQTKTGVTPTEQSQTITYDTGYDGLESVQINAVSSYYVGSNVPTQVAQEITPGTSDQTISSGTYLTGDQIVKGDANLIPANIISGKSIFGVSGSASTGNIATKTTTNSDATATSLAFSSLSGAPKAFFLRCTSQLTRSSSYSYYYIVSMRYNGTNTNGNYWRMSNGTFYNDTSHYSYTYSNGTLTLSSSAARGSAGGSFYNGDYELTYIY